MTRYELYPAYMQLGYTTYDGNHIATIPTTALVMVGDTYELFLSESETISGQDAAEDYATNVIAKFIGTGASINFWTLFNVPVAGETGVPVASGSLDINGVLSTVPPMPGYQASLSFRTSLFHNVRFNILGAAGDGTIYKKKAISALSSGQSTVVAWLLSSSNRWIRGRDGGYVGTFLSLSTNVNNAIEKRAKRFQ